MQTAASQGGGVKRRGMPKGTPTTGTAPPRTRARPRKARPQMQPPQQPGGDGGRQQAGGSSAKRRRMSEPEAAGPLTPAPGPGQARLRNRQQQGESGQRHQTAVEGMEQHMVRVAGVVDAGAIH